MMIFDLLLIVVVLATVALLLLAAVAGIQGRKRSAKRYLVRCCGLVVTYVAVVVVVSLVQPQRVVEMGEDWCFDDWCVAVDDVRFESTLGPPEAPVRARGVYCVVTLRLSNRARGRPQHPSSAAVHLVDGRGHTYEPSPAGQDALERIDGPEPALTSILALGQSVETVRVFDIPIDATNVGLTVEHPVGFAPGILIVGDQASLFHRRTVVRLN